MKKSLEELDLEKMAIDRVKNLGKIYSIQDVAKILELTPEEKKEIELD